MKSKYIFGKIFILQIGLLLTVLCTGQMHYSLNYECLETPVEFNDIDDMAYFIECDNGLPIVSTLENPCIEGFYGQDGFKIRAHYYNHPGSGSFTEYAFGSIALKEDDAFDDTNSKYFELNQTTLWYDFAHSNNLIHRLSVKVKDFGGGGINFGTDWEIGPVFYTNFEELANHEFDNIDVSYEDELLTVEGELHRLIIGGGNIYVANIEFNEFATGINDDEAVNSIQVYPNPTSGLFFLEGEGLNDSQVVISDFTGKQLFSEYTSNGHRWEKDLTALPTSSYWVRVVKDNEITFSKVLLKH